MNLDLTKTEYDYLLALLAERPWKESHLLIMKMGAQGQAQARGNGDAVAGIGERSDSRAPSPRIAAEVAPPDHSDSVQQRSPRPAKR